jgi:hypothetical protein
MGVELERIPGISSSEVLSELRRMQPNLKVILTSAYSRDWAENTLGLTQK